MPPEKRLSFPCPVTPGKICNIDVETRMSDRFSAAAGGSTPDTCLPQGNVTVFSAETSDQAKILDTQSHSLAYPSVTCPHHPQPGAYSPLD